MGLLFMMAVRFYPRISYLVHGFMQAGIDMITSAKSQFWFGHANPFSFVICEFEKIKTNRAFVYANIH